MLTQVRCANLVSSGAPDLRGVTERREERWLVDWLRSPETMIAHDDTAKALMARFRVPMPNQNLTATDIERLLAYLRWASRNPPPTDMNMAPFGSAP